MNRIFGVFVGGLTFLTLTGERKQAFIRQRYISVGIAVVAVAAMLVVMAVGGETLVVLPFVAVACLTQFAYASERGETLWQLRIREIRHRQGLNKTNKEALLAYAADLQRKGKGHGKD